MSAEDDVTETHPSYDDSTPDWRLVRDVTRGSRAVKARGAAYLPRPGAMSDEDYNAYRDRALFYGATKWTFLGLIGAIFRKAPQIVGPDNAPVAFTDLVADANAEGVSMEMTLKRLASNVLSVGRHGLLVDWSEKLGRVVFQTYRAENIINWARTVPNGADRPSTTQVVLREFEDVGTGFQRLIVPIYRVLEIDGDGYYAVRVFVPENPSEKPSGAGGGKDRKYVEDKERASQPKMRGKRIDRIPFFCAGTGGVDIEVGDIPLLDLAEVNVSHYVTSANLETAQFKTAQPMYVVTGIGKNDRDEIQNAGGIITGSNRALVLPPGSDAKVIEPAGSGLASLEKTLDKKEAQMRSIGARLIGAPKNVGESAEAKLIDRAGEESVLMNVSDSGSEVGTEALQFAAEWSAFPTPEKYSVEINRDFFSNRLSPSEIKELVASWQSGAISREVLFHVFQDGEIIPAAMTLEEMVAQIEAEAVA